MFIRKKHYKELCKRIDNLERSVTDIPKEFDEKLCGFATDVEEVQSKLSEMQNVFDKRCEYLAEIIVKICDIEKVLPTLRQDTDKNFYVFAETIGELQDKVSDLDDGLDRDTREKNRKFDDDFRDGIANIMNYEVLDGRKRNETNR